MFSHKKLSVLRLSFLGGGGGGEKSFFSFNGSLPKIKLNWINLFILSTFFFNITNYYFFLIQHTENMLKYLSKNYKKLS